jgi:ribonuclease E
MDELKNLFILRSDDASGADSGGAGKKKRRRRGGRGRKRKGSATGEAPADASQTEAEATDAAEPEVEASDAGEAGGETEPKRSPRGTRRKRGGEAPVEVEAADAEAGEDDAGERDDASEGDGAPAERESEPAEEGADAATEGEPRKGRRRRGEGRGEGRGARGEGRGRGREDRAEKGARAKREGEPFTQMIINYVPGEECRVAVVEDRKLEELYTEKFASASHVGNIYVGKVMNVEPAIQAAFVDFGMGENGFLHVTDLHPRYFPGESEEGTTERIGIKTPRRDRPPIQAALRRGDEIIVQVLKEGVGTKGPTLTSYLSIPGRFLVMMPYMDKVGVSRKVEDEEERRKMREILDQLELPDGFGFILRTAGMTRTKAELKRDLAYLMRLWKDMDKRLKAGGKPRLLYSESDLLVRALRDVLTSETHEVIVDNEHALQRAARYLKIVSPRTNTKLLHLKDKSPIFHAFGIEKQISLIHAREVPLPSGGRLVIDQTEALVAIDVNSGKSRDSRDSETNAYQTNIEAVDEICRQLRLRDMGGIVINDLIDMRFATHRKDIQKRFEERLRRDRAKSTVLPISEFGILELTRQRMRPSHESVHFNDCPTCRGRGLIQKPDSVTGDALRDLAALLDVSRVHRVEMVVAPRVAGDLLSTKRQLLSRVERTYGKHVDVRVSEAVAVDRVTFYAYDQDGADLELGQLPQSRKPTNLVELDVSDEAEASWAGDLDQEAREAEASLVEPEPDDSDVHPIELDLSDEEVDRAIAEGARVAPSGDDRSDRGGRGDRGRRGRDRGRGRGDRDGRFDDRRDGRRDGRVEARRDERRDDNRGAQRSDQRDERREPAREQRAEPRRDDRRDGRRDERRDDRGGRGGGYGGRGGGRGGPEHGRRMRDDTDEWGEPMTREVGDDGDAIETRRGEEVGPGADAVHGTADRDGSGETLSQSEGHAGGQPSGQSSGEPGATEVGPDGLPRKKRRRRRRRRGRGQQQLGPDGQPLPGQQGGSEPRPEAELGDDRDNSPSGDDEEWGDDAAPRATTREPGDDRGTTVVLRDEAIDDGDAEDDGAVDVEDAAEARAGDEPATGEAGGEGGDAPGEGGRRKRRRRRRRGRGGNAEGVQGGDPARNHGQGERRDDQPRREDRRDDRREERPREPRPEPRTEAPRPPVEVAPLPRADALKPPPRTLYGNIRRKLTPADLARKPKPE